MKKSTIIHPFLFAIYPILFLYSYNIEVTKFDQTILPAAIILCITLFIILFLTLTLKNIIKAGIIVTTFLILFFSYGHFLEFLKILDRNWDNILIIGRSRYLLPIWIITLTVIIYLVKKTENNLIHFNKVLNVVSTILVGISIINIFIYKIDKVNASVKNIDLEFFSLEPNTIDSTKIINELPDIYYIVPDMFTSANVLKEFYGYDNIELYQFLRQNNFYIAENSKSNYSWTNTSLSSSLNMDYLHNLINLSDENINIGLKTAQLIENNKVMGILKSLGYDIINIQSGVHITNNYRNANLNIQPGVEDELIVELVRTSMLLHIDGLFGEIKRNRILNTFEEIGKIPEIDKPTFVMAHLNVPHGPYIFGKGGERVWFSKMFYENHRWKGGEIERKYYLNQLIFVSEKLTELVNSILQNSSVKPIIIIQGDHGPASFMPKGPWPKNPTEKMLMERMGILNAIYLPHSENNLLYNSISPVNTFRIILNQYFGANYNLFEDKHYYSNTWTSNEFVNVTNLPE